MYKMDAPGMKMLRCRCGKTRKDKIRNECLEEYLGVASMGDNIKEIRLRWFGHVQRRPATALVRKSFSIKVDGPPRGRDRPKRT